MQQLKSDRPWKQRKTMKSADGNGIVIEGLSEIRATQPSEVGG